MIPKIIHYCWFGGNPKPELAKNCINSWKKYCKDYEIKEWNEDNFDIPEAPLYVRQAYEAKKWAFVSDYVRLWAMIKYGGIYMDTDMEVIKPIDKFLENEAFGGFESTTTISTAIMACKKDYSLFKVLLSEYDNIPFVRDDGSFDETTNVKRITNCCKKYGFVPDGKYQVVNGFALYPKEYFCPKSPDLQSCKITRKTYTIHHYMGSWISDEDKEKYKKHVLEIKKKEKKIKRKQTIDKIIHFPNWLMMKILGKSRYEKIKKKLKR